MRNINVRVTVTLLVVGVVSGLLSGLFGIGGGTVIVPALVLVGLTQRQAAATSLAAIVPTSISGVVSYATAGDVDWIAALLLACGMVAGSQIGSWLLSRLPEVFLRWFYAAFLVFVIVSQVVFTPLRDSAIHLHVVTGILLVALGVVIGVLSGLLGIGGGAVAVPSLSLLFGASDLIARGTSLLAMFPSAIAGTAANWKRGLVYQTWPDHRRMRRRDGAVGHDAGRHDYAAYGREPVRGVSGRAVRAERVDGVEGDTRDQYLKGA